MGELDQFCRFCTQKPHRSRRRNLFETENSQLLEIAMRCIPLQMAANDRYSKFTCYPCAYKLSDIAKFQSNGLSAVNFFEEFLAKKEKHSSSSAEYCRHDATTNNVLFEETEMDFVVEFTPKLEKRLEEEIEAVDIIEDEADLFLKHKQPYHLKECVVKLVRIEDILPAMESMPAKPVENVALGVDDESSSENQCIAETDNVGSTKKPFLCDLCNKMFRSRWHLNSHFRIHSGEKPFGCEYCKKIFGHKNTLVDHIRTHTGEKPFECEYCKKCFRHRKTLLDHVRIHTGEKPFECEYCNKSFVCRQGLVCHVRCHTGEKRFECEFCKKRFGHKRTLVSHVRIHTGKSPFECEYCNKSFGYKKNLVIHVRTHTGENSFVCEYCKKVFGYKKALVNHVKSHNGGKPFECGKKKIKSEADFGFSYPFADEICNGHL